MTSFQEIENPALRLHSVLAALKPMANNIRRDQAISEILEVPVGSPEVNMGIARLLMLPERIIDALPTDQSTADADLYLAWEAGSRAALAGFAQPHEPLDGVQRSYDEGTLMSLKAAGLLIRSTHHHTETAPADLAQIKADFEILATEIRGSTAVDAKLRRFLLDTVEETIRAIDLYPITGEAGVRQAVEQYVGAMNIRYNGINPTADQPVEVQGFWNRTYSGVKVMLVLLSVADTGIQLVDNAAKMITGRP